MEPGSSTDWLRSGLPLIGGAVLGIVILGFVAAAEMAFASVNRSQLRQISERRGRAQAAESLLAAPARLLSTLLVLKVAGKATFLVCLTLLNLLLFGGGALVWWVLGGVVAILVAQILARGWVVSREQSTALAFTPWIRIFAFLLAPLTGMLRRVGSGAAPSGAAPESIFLSEDGLRFLMNVSDEEGVIEDEEKELIKSIFEFSDKLVREVMVPRMDVVAVPGETPMVEALDVILKGGHSRLPVYQDSIDNVVGILYAKDLLRYLRDQRIDVPITRILRTAHFVPESKKVDELLQEMQQRKVHMAIVVDEYGGMAGVVTIEDLLEEIVGEIQDEFDAEEATVEAISETEYRFDARIPLDEVNELLGIELPDVGGDTLGGFIYGKLGKVPAVGDTVEIENGHMEVLSVAGRRIKQVRAVIQTAGDGGGEDGGPRDGGNGSPPRTDGNGRSGPRDGDGGGPGLLSFLSLH